MPSSIYLVVEHDANEERGGVKKIYTFISFDEAVEFVRSKSKCNLYAVTDVLKLI